MRRLLVALSAITACLGTALVLVPPAHAGFPPGFDPWPICTSPTEEYCIQSQTRNGVEVDPSGDGYKPYVDALDSGTVRYGVERVVGPDRFGDVDPADTYRLVVRTGDVRPREVDGNIRDVAFVRWGNATDGYGFTLSFRPTPVHHVGYGGDTRSCTVAACGDDTWRASLEYDGFVTGYVTDLASSGLGTAEIAQRTGMISAYNAQDANTFYDFDTNSLVVQLANPHLTGSGALATGSYEAFLPNAFLTGTMNVPDPDTLSAGTVTVVRSASGASSSAPFTLTHTPAGIWVRITGITYSRPSYRVHPGPSTPRRVRAHKVSPHKARVSFRRPAHNLGYRINRYQARCHRLHRVWHSAKGTASPITVGRLPRGRVYCQVRAHNKLGWGVWSPVRHT